MSPTNKKFLDDDGKPLVAATAASEDSDELSSADESKLQGAVAVESPIEDASAAAEAAPEEAPAEEATPEEASPEEAAPEETPAEEAPAEEAPAEEAPTEEGSDD